MNLMRKIYFFSNKEENYYEIVLISDFGEPDFIDIE